MSRVGRIAAGVAAGLGLSLGTATIIVEDWVHDEGWRLVPYRDSAGIWTSCAGHTGPDVVPGRPWTEAECEAITVIDIVKHGKPVLDRLVNPATGEVIAWIGFAGNVGVNAFLQSTALKLQRTEQRVAACEQLRRWVYITVDGRKLDCRDPRSNCRGLPDRRERQLARCMSNGTVLQHFKVT